MRWTIKDKKQKPEPKPEPKPVVIGDKKTITKFAWYPIIIGENLGTSKKRVWLETYRETLEYMSVSKKKYNYMLYNPQLMVHPPILFNVQKNKDEDNQDGYGHFKWVTVDKWVAIKRNYSPDIKISSSKKLDWMKEYASFHTGDF